MTARAEALTGGRRIAYAMLRSQHFDLAVPRPGWITAGAIRLALLSLFVILVAMVRPRLTPDNAGWVVLGGALGAVALGILLLIATRRAAQGPSTTATGRATEAAFVTMRRIGLPVLALTFFLVWTFVYIGVWWAHPEDAFRGLEPEPRFADFFYTAVSTAFVSPPGDIIAHSRGARAATVIEMMTAFALVTAYASSFIDWHRRSEPEDGG
jgi:hypothetical protein